jgi:hypothetical protein
MSACSLYTCVYFSFVVFPRFNEVTQPFIVPVMKIPTDARNSSIAIAAGHIQGSVGQTVAPDAAAHPTVIGALPYHLMRGRHLQDAQARRA